MTTFKVTGYCPCEKCCGKKANPKTLIKFIRRFGTR